MSDENLEMRELDANERRLFASLPREMALDPATEESVVRSLRADGFFKPHLRGARPALRIAAAAALMLAGGIVGAVITRVAERSSLEAELARADLTIADRILLLQRAGSAYVKAAHAYADATARTDSSAVEVAQQVLVGAAHALVRSRLDAGMAAGLTNVLQDSTIRRVSRPRPNASPLIWY
jgi:type IV secretory pathway VirJ component